MTHFDDPFSLNNLPEQISVSDPSLRLTLLHHCVDLLRQLTHPSPQDPPSQSTESLQEESASSSGISDSTPVTHPAIVCDYGDEASLDQARMEALEVFDSRRLDVNRYVVLWMDRLHVWGHPLLLCIGATEDGYRHFLNFEEAPALDIDAIQRFLCALLERGLCTESGLLCITSGDLHLSQRITELLHPMGIQHCQHHKREQVLSHLGETDSARIKGAMMRAYSLPIYGEAHTALMQVHADLLECNSSAAQCFEEDLEHTLTVVRTGHMDKLSRSLRSTRCLIRVAEHLNHRLKEIRCWLPPVRRRAQIALLCLENELHMRRLDHASELPALRTTLRSKQLDPSKLESDG
ncbi:MAG: transposase [Bacteroidetes bacterium]|nr:transposase [Bacteroidota bacterium]